MAEQTMKAMGRVVKLYVGNFKQGNIQDETEALDLSELDIEFEVTRSIEWYDNEARITVYNPAQDTAKYIMTEGNSVLLQAGHETATVGTIFVGQIGMAKVKRSRGNIAVELSCVSARGAFYQLARLCTAVSFTKGTTIRECLETMAGWAGIALRAGFSKKVEQGIPWHYHAVGPFNALIKDFTENLLWPEFGLKTLLDNNELILLGDRNNIELEEIVLDYDNGLLGATEIRDESMNKVNFGDDPAYYYFSGSEVKVNPKENRKPVQIDRPKTVSFRAIISPRFAPNVFVELDSRTGTHYDSVMAVQGRFIITSCEFTGGNIGSDFTVECEAMEVETIKENRNSRVTFNRGAKR